MRSTLRSFLLLLALVTTWQGASLANAATTARNLEIAVVVDNALYVALGSSEPAAQAFANQVMSGLLPITGPDLSIRVQTVSVVVRTGADGWTATTTAGGETSSSSLLVNFQTWAATNLSMPHDVPVLLSGRNFDGSTIGLAGVGVACRGRGSSGAIVQATFAAPYVTTVVAHELGHTLGMGHDGSGSSSSCPSSGFIMAGVGCSNCGVLPTDYSTCSVNTFANWFSLGGSCLLDDVPSCGNGVRQAGEQCDSGADWSTDACCTPWWSADGCQLEPGCDCAVSDGCCTAGTPDTAGTACRPATSVCDVAEQCDGTSSFCPPDLHGAIGTPCGTDGACGPGGTCASPYAQCLTMPSLGFGVTIFGSCPRFTTCSMLACTVTSTGGCTTFTLSATTSIAPAPGTPCGDGMVCDGLDACVPTALVDACPYDDSKTAEGICGCGVPDIDTDEDGLADCVDRCPLPGTDPSCAQCQTAADCDDNDPSTIDICDPQGTCLHNHPPVARCQDVTLDATTASCSLSATINNGSSDLDNGDTLTLQQTPAGPYGLGSQSVTLTVIDSHGAQSTCTSTVTVRDPIPPPLSCPGSVTAECSGASTVATFATPQPGPDNCGSAQSTGCSPASGSGFNLGTTTVSCGATDTRNTSSCSFSVNVADTIAPSIGCPASPTVEATSAAGAAVSFSTPTASDACTTPIVSCDALSGATFPLSTSTVNCSASDGRNSSSCSFTITVHDTTPPRITCPASVTVQSGQPIVLGTPAVSDIVDSDPNVSNNAPTTYPLGQTTVTWTARDDAGNPVTCYQLVTVLAQSPFTGFFAPVDNPPLVNTMKAGSAVPVKFSFGGNQGLAIFAAGYPKSQPIACNTGSPTDTVEETVTAGGSTLTYDATTDQYQYVWKTDKAWKGCRQLILQFTDGTTKTALFEFK